MNELPPTMCSKCSRCQRCPSIHPWSSMPLSARRRPILFSSLMTQMSSSLINHINLSITVNSELITISVWFRASKLSLNIKKQLCALSISSQNCDACRSFHYSLIIFLWLKSSKFLGVFVDEHLTWNGHINNISNPNCQEHRGNISHCLFITK